MIESSKSNLKKIIQNIVSNSTITDTLKAEIEKNEDGSYLYFTCPANTVVKENRLKDFSFSFVKRNSAIEKYQALKIESNKTPFVFNVPNNKEELVLTPRCFGKGGRDGEGDIRIPFCGRIYKGC